MISVVLWAALGWADEEPARVERFVTVDMVERVENPGNLEFVGCSKACHDTVGEPSLLEPAELDPDDRMAVEIDGTWPVTTTLSMRSDLYYFALVGEEGAEPEERFFSLRTHHGSDENLEFEITTTPINVRPGMGEVPGVDDVEGLSPSHPLEGSLTAEVREFAPEAPEITRARSSFPLRQILSFLGAVGLGGLLGWWFNRR